MKQETTNYSIDKMLGQINICCDSLWPLKQHQFSRPSVAGLLILLDAADIYLCLAICLGMLSCSRMIWDS